MNTGFREEQRNRSLTPRIKISEAEIDLARAGIRDGVSQKATYFPGCYSSQGGRVVGCAGKQKAAAYTTMQPLLVAFPYRVMKTPFPLWVLPHDRASGPGPGNATGELDPRNGKKLQESAKGNRPGVPQSFCHADKAPGAFTSIRPRMYPGQPAPDEGDPCA
jgi:hypothetical protein